MKSDLLNPGRSETRDRDTPQLLYIQIEPTRIRILQLLPGNPGDEIWCSLNVVSFL
jgi:hypothetical protein